MRAQKTDLIAPCLLILATLAVANTALAQSSPTEPLKAATPGTPTQAPAAALATAPLTPTPALKSAAAPAPAAVAAPTPPLMTAKELEGLDAFGVDGQQIGKVTKVEVGPDGKLKDVEVQTKGFLSFFKKTYVVPVEKLTKKGGRIDVSMTNEQVKQLAK